MSPVNMDFLLIKNYLQHFRDAGKHPGAPWDLIFQTLSRLESALPGPKESPSSESATPKASGLSALLEDISLALRQSQRMSLDSFNTSQRMVLEVRNYCYRAGIPIPPTLGTVQQEGLGFLYVPSKPSPSKTSISRHTNSYRICKVKLGERCEYPSCNCPSRPA